MFGAPGKPGAASLAVLGSCRLQATRKTAQATSSERRALPARVFDVDMLGSKGLGKSILHDSAESAAQTSAGMFKARGLRINGLPWNPGERKDHPLTLLELVYPGLCR